MTFCRLRGLAVLALLGGCGDADPIPQKPTWVDDAEPILRGNCFQCHGPAANPTVAQLRWDFYDPQDPQLADIGTFNGLSGAKIHMDLFLGTKTYLAGSPAQMPPPPATVLTANQVETLLRWKAQGYPRGMRAANRAPTVTWIEKGKTFAVADRDHEQVLGKITCGGVSAQLDRSGAHALPAGAQPPCTLLLFDGQTLVRDAKLD